ncbi:hypothetical protein [Streptomyces erythrochromogenes]|uniref:hypothetical protein n=1 Tax=Streptomyces erythrochromogenes TaxID=285574 RepID=UPI0037F6D8A6
MEAEPERQLWGALQVLVQYVVFPDQQRPGMPAVGGRLMTAVLAQLDTATGQLSWTTSAATPSTTT